MPNFNDDFPKFPGKIARLVEKFELLFVLMNNIRLFLLLLPINCTSLLFVSHSVQSPRWCFENRHINKEICKCIAMELLRMKLWFNCGDRKDPVTSTNTLSPNRRHLCKALNRSHIGRSVCTVKLSECLIWEVFEISCFEFEVLYYRGVMFATPINSI